MGKSTNMNKILIAGLPPGSTSADLTKLVKPIGNPLSTSLAVDADGKDRGFAFVQFADATTQQAAITALDKTALAGRTLHVRAVEERAPGGEGERGGASQRTAGGNRGRPCYEFARGKCMRGAACRWAHVAPPSADSADGARSRRPEWQQKRGGEAMAVAAGGGDATAFFTDIPEDVCRKFQLGKCHRGEACRWRHVIWGKKGAAGGGGEGGGDASGGASPAKAEKRAATAAAGAGDAASGSKRARRDGPGETAPLSAAAQADMLRSDLRQREITWREAHPEHPRAAAVPAAAKRRDPLWMALERQCEAASA